MAISTASIDAIPDYTAAHQLKMWRKASIDVAAAGTSTAINGRVLSRSNASEIQNMIVFWTEQVRIESGGADVSGIALIAFDEPR